MMHYSMARKSSSCNINKLTNSSETFSARSFNHFFSFRIFPAITMNLIILILSALTLYTEGFGIVRSRLSPTRMASRALDVKMRLV